MTTSTAVIVNPAAGFGRSAGAWERAREALAGAFGPLEELRTERPGHAVELARQAVERGSRRVVAFGGDGTFHEAAEGFLAAPEAQRRDAALAPYPAGSGCDFARHFRLSRGPELAAALAAGSVRRLDVVRADFAGAKGLERRHLVNMAGFGLAGDVAAAVARLGKPVGGKLSYLAVSVALLLRSRPRELELRLDGIPIAERRFHAVILANTSSTGGGMRVAPLADPEDGAFELLTIGDLSRLRMLLEFPRLYAGSHLMSKGIILRRGRVLEALSPDGRPSPLNLDGEVVGSLPARFELLRGALPVLLPALGPARPRG